MSGLGHLAPAFAAKPTASRVPPQVGLGLENSGTDFLFMTVFDLLLLAVGIAIYFRARTRTAIE